MKNAIALLLAFLSFYLSAQPTECIRTKALSKEEILQMPEFKGTKTIVAVSFDYKEVNTPSQLKEENGHYPIITKGYREVKKLSADSEYSILDILVNYHVKLKNGESALEAEGACYQPRTLFYFIIRTVRLLAISKSASPAIRIGSIPPKKASPDSARGKPI